MKRETFNLGMATLVNAFPSYADKVTAEMVEVYWADLRDIPDEKFAAGVAWCRHHLDFFPSIAKIGAASHGGNQSWHEDIVRQKRLEFSRKRKALEPPMSDAERLENRRKVMEIADSLARKSGAGK